MRIIVVGLGYVGLPLAVQLAKSFEVWGLDINKERVAELKTGLDRTGEIDADRLNASTLKLVSDPAECPAAEAYIVTVPTPITSDNQPDLSPVVGATKAIAKMIDGALRPVIVYESTVYPGVTEDVCGPLLEEAGLKRGTDFVLGYSPERINPGDKERTVDKIAKIVAGEDAETLERMVTIYDKVTSGGLHKASSIKVAEAAKVIENAQRDINIAFINEVTQIFARMDISIWDVLDAANTKWNFLPFQPGLVGGHCIGVDPYYLSFRAQQLGLDPKVVLAGRSTNDGMAAWIGDQIHAHQGGKPGKILMLGVTFKENVPDLRNSKVVDLVAHLKSLGHAVTVHDPLADPAEAQHEYALALDAEALSGRYDCVVGAVPHRDYAAMDAAALGGLLAEGGLLVDLKRLWGASVSAENALGAGKRYWSL